MSRLWYDTVELPGGTLNFSSVDMTRDQFMTHLREVGAILNPHGEPFVIRARSATRRRYGWEGKREVETTIGPATVLDR